MAEIVATNWAGLPEEALQDTRAEQVLLGALMGNSGLIRFVPPSFSVDHYADPLHAEVHRAIAEVAQPGVPVSIPVLQSVGLDDPEKRKYIASLLGAAISYLPKSVTLYAETVTDMYRRRGLYEAGIEMQREALSGRRNGTPAGAAIAIAQNRLDELVSVHGVGRPDVSLNDAMDEALRRADWIASGGETGVSTGFRSVDAALGGLEPGTMTVIAGRPGMGKSSIGWQIALNVAQARKGVLAISLEMSATELGRRALCALAGVPVLAVKNGYHEPHVTRLLKARGEMWDLPLTIQDSAGLTYGMIALKARAAKRRHGLGLIMVDHLHIVRPDDADVKHGATWAIGRVSGAMKRLAKEHDCPVVVLAQLNRGVEGRDDKRPTLADLRHTGDIEQDADAVGFVYRPEYYLGSEPKKNAGESQDKFSTRVSQWGQDRSDLHGKAELIFAKVRDGAPCTVPLEFRADTASFSEPSHG